MVTLYEPGATELLTASCREVLLDPGVTVVPLLNADVMPEGKPLIVNETGELKTFVIAGADGKFVPAVAKIDGDTVVVSSADVSTPANVRYAWMNWAEGCNLYNGAGLPAVPFRTDKE